MHLFCARSHLNPRQQNAPSFLQKIHNLKVKGKNNIIKTKLFILTITDIHRHNYKHLKQNHKSFVKGNHMHILPQI